MLAITLAWLLCATPAAAQLRTDRSSYDGRTPAEEPVEDKLRWIPRLVLLPLNVVFDVLVRRPQEAIASLVESGTSSVGARETDPALQLLPMLSLELDMLPALGMYFRTARWIDRTDLLLWAWHWDQRRLEGRIEARVDLAPPALLRIVARGGHREDAVFYGLGWDSAPDARARYAHTEGGGRIALIARPWRRSRVAAFGEVGVRRFDATEYGDEPTLDASSAQRTPGWPGYGAYRQGLRAVLDTSEALHASGVRSQLRVAHALDLQRATEVSWVKLDGGLGGTIVFAPEHAFEAHVAGALVVPLAEGEVPFTERALLGGVPFEMAGFLPGRLVGDSGAWAGARYRWGVWTEADAYLDLEVGNVFGELFEDFAFERLRFSGSLAIEGLGRREHGFRLLIGFGTEPFVSGAAPSSAHVALTLGRLP